MGPLHLESFLHGTKPPLLNRKGCIGTRQTKGLHLFKNGDFFCLCCPQASLAPQASQQLQTLQPFPGHVVFLWKLCTFIAYQENYFFESTALNKGFKYFVRTFYFIPFIWLQCKCSPIKLLYSHEPLLAFVVLLSCTGRAIFTCKISIA